MKIFQNDWGDLLADEMKKPYYQELRRFLIEEYRTRRIFPDMYAIFNALHYTAYADTKVVILGQDPYHGEGQAHGLSFSVQPGVEPPPSLVNIFRELADDLGCKTPNNGCLAPWAKQGVLLLNTVLTVRASPPHAVIESPHPSPLSAFRGFFGSRPFSRANAFLESTGQAPIDWQLPDV